MLPFENQKMLVVCLINIRVKNIKKLYHSRTAKIYKFEKKTNAFLNNECCLIKESPCIYQFCVFLVSYWMVSFHMCQINYQAQRKMVLSNMFNK